MKGYCIDCAHCTRIEPIETAKLKDFFCDHDDFRHPVTGEISKCEENRAFESRCGHNGSAFVPAASHVQPAL